MVEVQTAQRMPITAMPMPGRALWLLEHLNLQEARGDPEARWEINQLEFREGSDTLTGVKGNSV
jgi:hypothetical protein